MVSKRIDRRRFLVLAGGGTAATVFAASRYGKAVAEPRQSYDPAPFTLGVASGDPDHTGFVLWTRLAPDPANGGGMPNEPVEVGWELATDEAFADIVDSGTATATPEYAHAVHVTVDGLTADRWYWYRFSYDGTTSRVGRTRTLPAPGSSPERLRFAFASCQNAVGGNGPYPAYRDMVEHDDIDFVLHLGDYIYESADASLAGYRMLHTTYKGSVNLREAHARFPFILTWDDHEVQDNYFGTGPDLVRRANAYQAYYEHLPMRAGPPNGPDLPIYQRFEFGDLVEFSVLDTRQYRDDQACTDAFPAEPPCDDVFDPNRTMTGPEQETWLLDGLRQSTARWNVIAQQTIMAKFDYTAGTGESYNLDQWDGYPAARDRILNAIATDQPSNPVVISGDWHSHWVNDLLADFSDPASRILATEFVGTSISSGIGWDDAVRQGLPENPHVKFYEGAYRGWVLCDVTPERWVSTLRVVLDPADPNSTAHSIAVYEVRDGEPGAVRVDAGSGVVGAVTGADGSGLRNVQVAVSGAAALTTWTNVEGNFHAFVPAGEYAVSANGAGFEPASTTATVPDEGSARADFTLEPSVPFAVTGRAVPGPITEGTADDIVLGNELLAMAIAVTAQDPQLPDGTVGKPLDLAAVEHLDQLDWMNLPYLTVDQPSGETAWQQGLVAASGVEVLTNGPDRAAVRTVGTSPAVPGVEVTTTFTVQPGDPWIVAESGYANTGTASVSFWTGDVIDHDGIGQRGGVAGHGVISTPYGQQDTYEPTGNWIGMAGTDGQTYGISYQANDFTGYGNGSWMQSQRQVTLAAGESWTLTRRIIAIDNGDPDNPFAVLDEL